MLKRKYFDFVQFKITPVDISKKIVAAILRLLFKICIGVGIDREFEITIENY